AFLPLRGSEYTTHTLTLQIQGNFVPPILFTVRRIASTRCSAVICLGLTGRRWVACQVLPGFAHIAAMRSDLPCSKPDPLTLLPVARSPSRRHCCHRWWALTPPFHPLPACRR